MNVHCFEKQITYFLIEIFIRSITFAFFFYARVLLERLSNHKYFVFINFLKYFVI